MDPDAAPIDATAAVPAYVSIGLFLPSIDECIALETVVFEYTLSIDQIVVSAEVSLVGFGETCDAAVVNETDSSEEMRDTSSVVILQVLSNGDNIPNVSAETTIVGIYEAVGDTVVVPVINSPEEIDESFLVGILKRFACDDNISDCHDEIVGTLVNGDNV